MSIAIMKRGKAIQIRGLSKLLDRELRRATQLAGFRSVSEWLSRQTRAFIAEQRRIHGDLMDALTPLEQDIVRVVADGANDSEHIAEETMISERKLARLLDDLVDRGVLEIRRQGGKTDAARGARRPLYFVTEKYQSKTE